MSPCKSKKKRKQVRLWRMLEKPPMRLTFHPKRRGEYWRRVTVEMPLYEGLVQAIETEARRSLLWQGWPGEWLYHHLLSMMQYEHEQNRKIERKSAP